MTGSAGYGVAESTTRRPVRTAILAMVTVLVVALIGIYLITQAAGESTTQPRGVTVGDVTASRMEIEVNGTSTEAITGLRAGDLITLQANVTTAGAESRWMRTFIDVAGVNPGLAPYLSLYDGTIPSVESLKAAVDITDPITFPGYVGTAENLTLFTVQPFVLNGVGQSEAAGIATFPVAVGVYVDPQTPTDLLASAFAVTAIVQSLPYRTHPNIPEGDQWINGPRLALG
jgi:hypothetical protein